MITITFPTTTLDYQDSSVSRFSFHLCSILSFLRETDTIALSR